MKPQSDLVNPELWRVNMSKSTPFLLVHQYWLSTNIAYHVNNTSSCEEIMQLVYQAVVCTTEKKQKKEMIKHFFYEHFTTLDV